MGRRAILPAVALLLALSTMVVAQGHALMQRRTGAQVVAMTGDAEALEGGHDTSALGAIGWEPTPVSRRLKDGDTVTLGGTTLRAIHAPGHTRGATIWMTAVEDDGRRYTVAFFTTTTPNPGVPCSTIRATPTSSRTPGARSAS